MDQPNPSSAAARVMKNLGLEPDPWQLDVLRGSHSRLLLNCCRQAGKSTVVAVHALLNAIYTEDLLVLLVSPSHRQSIELFKTVTRFYERIKSPIRKRQTVQELALNNGSRIVSLPCKEETIRGYANVGLLIIDEASRVPDDLYLAVRPMLAVSRGRLICMSTPWGKRGFFYEAWAHGGDDWQRIQIRAQEVPRIDPKLLAQDRRCMRDAAFRREYECSFEAIEGLVYPDLGTCVVPALPAHLPEPGSFFPATSKRAPVVLYASGSAPGAGVKRIGGLDFGFRNPFAAVWGYLDREDVLWLVGEHYSRERPLSHNAAYLPRKVMWYADPSGANECSELTRAGFTVRKGINSICPGIAAVTARIQTGRLKILTGKCPNLLAESLLYRYDEAPRGKSAETPVDEHNHALAALRYLVSRIDQGKLARAARAPAEPAPGDAVAEDAPPPPPRKRDAWLRYDNEALWTRIF